MKRLNVVLTFVLLAVLGAFAACGGKVDEQGWEKAFDATLSAKNFYVKETMSFDEATVATEAKFDADNGKLWTMSKMTPSSSDEEAETEESYLVKGKNAACEYRKEGKDWQLVSEERDFDEVFDDWSVLGDGIKELLGVIKGAYSAAEYKDGKYSVNIEKSENAPSMKAEIAIRNGYLSSASIEAEGSTAMLEFFDYGSVKMPEVPSVSADK